MEAVVIVARNNDTGFTRSASTNAFGSYRIDDLLPGAYTVTAQHDGFQAVTVSPVFVEVNQKVRLDVELKVGSVHDTATVTAHASPLQTDEASEGYTLGSNFFEELPLLGRNIVDLVTLGPGAIPRQLGGFTHDIINDLQGNRGAVAFNAPVNGARSTENSYILDGADNTDRNTFSIAVMPLMESVAEFRIQSSLAPAEFAQSGGGVIDVVTKPGSQAFHGNLFEFFRNEATDATGFFAVPGLPQAIFRQNQYGGTLSGPLAQVHLFLCVLRRAALALVQFNAASGSQRGRSRRRISAAAPMIYDPLTLNANGDRAPFPNNVIPASLIDPTVAKYLALYEPLPNAPLANGFDYVDSTPNRDNSDNGSVRIDRAWGERSRLFARYTINDERSLLAGSFPALPTAENLRAQQIALGHTFAGASWVNETHFSFTRLRVFDLPTNAFGSNVLANLGITGLANDPSTLACPPLPSPTTKPCRTPTIFRRPSATIPGISAAVSRAPSAGTPGKPVLSLRISPWAYLQSLFVRGNFIFNGTYTSDPNNPNTTGDAFADFLLGYPAETQRSVGNAQAYLRQNTYAAYVQDDWRITPRISISAGLRYEYMAPFSEDRGNLVESELRIRFQTRPLCNT